MPTPSSSSSRPSRPARTAGGVSTTQMPAADMASGWRRSGLPPIRGTPHPAGALPRNPASGLHEALADRVADELDAIAHAELGEDVRAVPLHRLLADDEHLGDVAGRVRLGDQLEDLRLPRGERALLGIAAAPHPLEPVAHERLHGARIQERLAAHGGPARLDEVAVGDGLEHV